MKSKHDSNCLSAMRNLIWTCSIFINSRLEKSDIGKMKSTTENWSRLRLLSVILHLLSVFSSRQLQNVHYSPKTLVQWGADLWLWSTFRFKASRHQGIKDLLVQFQKVKIFHVDQHTMIMINTIECYVNSLPQGLHHSTNKTVL